MPNSFTYKKELRFVITTVTGAFGSSNSNTITLENFRSVAQIDIAGGLQSGTLRAQIYGISQDDMNAATVLQFQPGTRPNANTIAVYAIDGAQETLVFSGSIVNAWGDYSSQPNVFLRIQAQMAYMAQITPCPPLSFKGTIAVDTVMAQIAQNAGLKYENNGVTAQLVNPYLPNTSIEQARQLARAVPFDIYIDSTILAICPQLVGRITAQVPLISAQSGMKGYPTFDGLGVNFTTIFNPAIKCGGLVQVDSDLPQASGQWIATSLTHMLEAEKPGGSWFTSVRGIKPSSGLGGTATK